MKYTNENLVYYGPHPCQKCDKNGKNGTLIVKAGNGAPDNLEFDFPAGKLIGSENYPNSKPDWYWRRHMCSPKYFNPQGVSKKL